MRVIPIAVLAACSAPPVISAPPAEPRTPELGAPEPAPIAVPLQGCSWSFKGELAIGDRPYLLEIDTGSGVLALAGEACGDACPDSRRDHRYVPGPGAIDEHEPASARYGGGYSGWSGQRFQDDVSVGGASTRLSLFAISDARRFFGMPCGTADGILGLDGSLTDDSPFQLVDRLADRGLPRVFALHECVSRGTLWIGGYDRESVTADPIYVAMGAYGNTLDVTGFDVGDAHLDLPPTAALVDSGGPSILVPAPMFDRLAHAIAADATFATYFGNASWFTGTRVAKPALSKAELDAQLPRLVVHAGAVTIDMAATDSYLGIFRHGDETSYVSALHSSGNASFVDLGNSVIRSRVVIFDRGTARMGFAPALPCR
ncbi:MAG TPA: pepsin-like aspartic protease [Kofleriaceae bacterium]|nr:pepsin-like aspartic protease [Kofleriaceae bacterium]